MDCYSIYTDQELTYLLNKGDRDAFTEIHRRYYGVLYRHAYRNLPDNDEVKDVLQDIFSYLWNQRSSINPDENLAGYLYASIRHKLLNKFRHEKIKSNHIASFQDYINSSQPEADEAIRVKQLVSIVEAEVAKLPPQMRRIFEMSRNGNLSHHEISDELNISVLTVRKQVNNSLKVLRLKLDKIMFLFFLL